MMQQVRRVGVLQVAKVLAILYLVVGLLAALVIMALGSVLPMSGVSGMGLMAGGAMTLVAFPLLYACFGFVFGALMAWLYNLVAGWVGGFQIDLEPIGPS